jgi:hypothetical protein
MMDIFGTPGAIRPMFRSFLGDGLLFKPSPIRKQFMKKAIYWLRFFRSYIKIGKDMKILTKE